MQRLRRYGHRPDAKEGGASGMQDVQGHWTGELVRIVVTGSRSITDYNEVESALERACRGFGLRAYREVEELVSGNARGVDRLAEAWARSRGIPVKVFKPDWDRYGKSAGHRRNHEMADYVKTHGGIYVAIWDGVSKGTKGMIDYCDRIGLTGSITAPHAP